LARKLEKRICELMNALQQEKWQAFLQQEIPSRHDEKWKYTDVTFLKTQNFKDASYQYDQDIVEKVAAERLENTDSILVVFINGFFSPQLSTHHTLPEGVIIGNIQQALVTHAAMLTACWEQTATTANPFASLNMALMGDGLFLYVPPHTTISVPIHVLYLQAKQSQARIFPRNLIIASENSQVTLLEEYGSFEAQHYFTNAVTDIFAGVNAKVYYHKIQNEDLQATHIAQVSITQQQDSVVKTCGLSLGSRLARENWLVALEARGAENSVNGFYCLHQDGQHIDNYLHIDHIAPQGRSDMLYKGVVNKKSRAVFNGKILVHQEAQKTVAYQANHTLLLATDAEVNAKPELEIYADDVKCVHGNTVGQLDTEALFYLRSRGIEKNMALKLLTHAFAAEVMERVMHPAICQRMAEKINEFIYVE
jgi:Fe-S cluster assembly protein SufD